MLACNELMKMMIVRTRAQENYSEFVDSSLTKDEAEFLLRLLSNRGLVSQACLQSILVPPENDFEVDADTMRVAFQISCPFCVDGFADGFSWLGKVYFGPRYSSRTVPADAAELIRAFQAAGASVNL